MKKYSHKKKYGQNFLDSSEVLEMIKEVINLNGEEVLEIGPGHGFLTKMLLENSKHLTCYEIDTDLIPYLEKKFHNYPNFDLVNQDFMEADIRGNNLKVVANIPYYITSPIVEKLINNRDKIDEIFIMVQKEVANRICSDYSSKDVSTFTHFIRFYTEPKYLFTVKNTYFTPIPKVDSAFISLKIRKDKKYENMIDSKIYFKFINQAFSSKRKTLSNNLKGLGVTKEQLEKSLGSSMKRAEELSIEEFIKLIKDLDYDRL
ncbi:16S rRNA (adenine(1518)-N(6)/adenine(1519)-N(6))-dimethyltransferase RsmA [Oceanivirga salmonicida]|uniref:16S rRNA (adenine(1518)-N(6)/adenine(1519)-N(6))- dimethyltransferase RsmA n=1 Tax=Oceanivirga salmonicida TaxID=1769291 RepID=UPI00082C111B|nr:16S rRNA (adenine(1518)-N(6)/adenine(1519)-N(6))-dimethyltransferase RsmA [Oceanivirga salmonicida]